MFCLCEVGFYSPTPSASSPSILPPSPDGAKVLRESWEKTREILDKFWEKWKQTYLLELGKKSRWFTSSEGPKINQIVLLKDDNSPRESWRMARVTKILNSDPNHVRRVSLKDGNGTVFDRHITGVVPLEFDLNP